MLDEIKFLNSNRKMYAGSTDRLSDDEPCVEFIVHPGRLPIEITKHAKRMSRESNYGLWAKANSENLKPIMKYKGIRKVKARLRKKKSICVGHIDKDGCYHILMGSPSFKGAYDFFSRCLSYNKRVRKISKFKRR